MIFHWIRGVAATVAVASGWPAHAGDAPPTLIEMVCEREGATWHMRHDGQEFTVRFEAPGSPPEEPEIVFAARVDREGEMVTAVSFADGRSMTVLWTSRSAFHMGADETSAMLADHCTRLDGSAQ